MPVIKSLNLVNDRNCDMRLENVPTNVKRFRDLHTLERCSVRGRKLSCYGNRFQHLTLNIDKKQQ